jgi:DNA-binding transcriptional LysR family regulator
MVLTKAGTQLIPYVDDVLASVNRMSYFENDLAECQGDLNIGIAETQLCYKMPSILKQFHQQAPNARLLLRSMNCYDIRNELINGTLDLGVFYEDVGGFGSNLTTYSLGEYSVILVASPEMKKQHSDFITPDRNISVSFIINEVNCIFRQMFEQYLREKSIMIDHTIELWSIPTIKNLVKSNVGVSFLPKFAVQEELDRGELVEIPTNLKDAQISAVCGHHKNKWISPLMQAFIDLCAKK